MKFKPLIISNIPKDGTISILNYKTNDTIKHYKRNEDIRIIRNLTVPFVTIVLHSYIYFMIRIPDVRLSESVPISIVLNPVTDRLWKAGVA